jgi:RNA-splicing ligase RtcB
MNRRAIVDEIMTRMGLTARDRFTTIHNYIDLDSMILRKGAISARKGERVLIPINMRDGSLICIGKGNADWNFSAPHGAGRIMSRREAKRSISLEEYAKTMEGIYSTTVNRSTLDECALAYKPMDEIIANIRDTVEVVEIIKPIYNFKAAG